MRNIDNNYLYDIYKDMCDGCEDFKKPMPKAEFVAHIQKKIEDLIRDDDFD